MQRIVENEEKCLHSPINGSRALQIGNANNLESSLVSSIKNLKLEFPRFQGEDPTCWIYKTNQFFSYHNTLEHQKVIIALCYLDGKALIWFQDLNKQVALLVGRSSLELCNLVLVPRPMMI